MPAHAAGPSMHPGRAAGRLCKAEGLPLCPCSAAPRQERRPAAGKRPARQGAGPRAHRPQALAPRPDARPPRRTVCRAGSAAADVGAWDAAGDGAPAAEEVQPPAGPVSSALAQVLRCKRSLGLLGGRPAAEGRSPGTCGEAAGAALACMHCACRRCACQATSRHSDGEGDRRTPGAQAAGNATFFQSVVNVINILSGVGLLSLPFALKKSGWAGLGVLWLLGFVTNYTGAAPGPGRAAPLHGRVSGCWALFKTTRARPPAPGRCSAARPAGRDCLWLLGTVTSYMGAAPGPGL